ncbi:phosphodiester glycosidase family protein [bacterium]|nr:phosphodiester glycosidase family protein [bacterium]
MKKLILFFLFMLIPAAAFAEDITVSYTDGFYHIVLNGNKIKKKIEFVQSDELITNKEIHDKYNSRLTINTGFFDLKNKKTISYIVNNKKIIADPTKNCDLMNNKELAPYMDKILNRSELRIVKCGLKYKYQIARHSDPVCKHCKIIASAQGGPQLLPVCDLDKNLQEEFFIVRKNGKVIRQSASVLFRTARTIVGIKNDELHILIFTTDNAKTISEAAFICRNFGFEKAMAFDGGSSTSLDYKDIHVISTQFQGDTGRRLKSFMSVK